MADRENTELSAGEANNADSSVDHATPIRRRRRRDTTPESISYSSVAVVEPPRRLSRRFADVLSSWGLSPTFRVFLFLSAIVGVMAFFLYNEYVIEQLRHQERNRAALYANLYGLASSHHLPEEFSEQIWSTVIFNREIDFPIIVTDHRGEIMIVKGHVLPHATDTSETSVARLHGILEQMDAGNQPVKFFESAKARGLIYFDGRNLVLTDLAGEVVTWGGPDLPAASDSTRFAKNAVMVGLEALRAVVDSDSIVVAADGFSHLYVAEDGFIVVDGVGDVVKWGGERFPGKGSEVGRQTVQEMAAVSQPRSFRIRTEKFIHYSQSDMIEQISLAPLVTLGVLVMFSLIGYIGFRNIRRSEQRSIWVGMAKETAHQLGTPLSSLSGWLELMNDSGVGADRDSIVREMQKDMRRLNQIASRFSQIGSVPGLRPLDVRSALSETINYFRGRGPQFGRHTFEVEFEDLPPVPLNAELMGWAFENLFKNSMDAIGTKDGTIAVRTYRDGDVVKITVRDNGRGIEADNIARVFEPGFSTKKRGWGLGLAFVKRIVEEYHSGRIQIVHSATGEGTTFELELPVWQDDNPGPSRGE